MNRGDWVLIQAFYGKNKRRCLLLKDQKIACNQLDSSAMKKGCTYIHYTKEFEVSNYDNADIALMMMCCVSFFVQITTMVTR